ncbi:inorganic phosphate transporter [candidate division KSB1 bacterium]|nr:inorganic phosphate transporter [candidate division KSB1 bacterium]
MEFYIFILVILGATAISDLIIGVSNDAVNFLNSAIGAKAASRKVIMIVAAIGVLFGTTFSSGMMEVARKGIFNPEFFVMHEVMIIFLAVMLGDILLLDLYNTFGLPTSTTVSIVFEIFGGAVAVALLKIHTNGENFSNVFNYINTKNVILIIAGIGLSIVFAFIFGVFIQFITRLIFTFNYEKLFKRIGSVYCSIALTAITYFILVKGAKGSTLINEANAEFLKNNLWQILLFSLIVWTVIWQLILSFTRINVLKIIVLIGTFALALAFAANDLVNFIGAPLGALAAYRNGVAIGGDPYTMTMESLKNPVRANTLILLTAGIIMVVTLWRSKKAQGVTKTTIDLGRQYEGVERFESIALARGIVRMVLSLADIMQKIIPQSVRNFVNERIDPKKIQPKPAADGEVPAFDMLRAAVNLMVASALVSFGTSLKLPLSTTFVTFMVSMSTSLADKSWGRESAVYRVTGVLTVLGGWFFTAFMAFTSCFLFTMFIMHFKLVAIIILVFFAGYFFIRTTKFHKEREDVLQRKESKLMLHGDQADYESKIASSIGKYIEDVTDVVERCYEGLLMDSRKKLRNLKKEIKNIDSDRERIIGDIFLSISNAEEEREEAPIYAKKIGAMQVIASNLRNLVMNNLNHIENNHRVPTHEQAEEMKIVSKDFRKFMNEISECLFSREFKKQKQLSKSLSNFRNNIAKLNKNQMKRIKKKQTGSRQSLLFVNDLTQIERIAEQSYELFKLHS